MKHTNIGVQLFPIVLLIGGMAFYFLGATVQAWFCIALAILMWFTIFSENYKNNKL